jgi:hypothetical protein
VRKYLLDKAALLFFGLSLGVVLTSPYLCGHIIWLLIILEAIDLISVGILCWQIVIFPVDLVLGKLKTTVYYSSVAYFHKYEFFKGVYCEWKLYWGDNRTLTLTVPDASGRNPTTIAHPQQDEKVVICYYRLSRILVEWHKAQD